MISVRNAYEFGTRIPEHIYIHLSKTCKYCDSPIVLNDNLTVMRCSNDGCVGHGAHRASNMFKRLQVKGFGPSTCRKLMMHLGITNHVKLVDMKLEDFPSYMGQATVQNLYESLQFDREIELPFLLELCQVEGIAGRTAERIIGDFNSFEEYFTKYPLPDNILDQIKQALKRKKTTQPLVKMSINLWKAKEDLLESEKLFTIRKREDLKFSICMTGEIITVTDGKSFIRPRSKFIDLLNKKYEGIATFINSEKSIASSEVLLLDHTKGKKKVNYARMNNIPIMKYNEFMKLLEDTLGKGNESIIMKWGDNHGN